MKRNQWVLLIVVSLIAGLAGLVIGRLTQQTSSDVAGDASQWLFSHTAEAGTIEPNGDDTWTLTLADVDPVVLGFTDRPLRDAQAGTIEKLIEAWPVMFADSNPNGVVVAHNAQDETNSAVVELSNPELEGSTLTYTVRVLTNEGGPASPGVIYNFEQVSVFIDDVPVTSWVCENTDGGVVDPPGVLNAPIATDVWRSQCQIKGGYPVPKKG